MTYFYMTVVKIMSAELHTTAIACNKERNVEHDKCWSLSMHFYRLHSSRETKAKM